MRRVRALTGLGLRVDVLNSLSDVAVENALLGDIHEAITAWGSIVEQAVAPEHAYLAGVALGNLAMAEVGLSRFAEARKHILRARALFAPLGPASPGVPSPEDLAEARGTIDLAEGNLELEQGRPKEAATACRRASEQAMAAGANGLLARSEGNLTLALSRLGARQEAIHRLERWIAKFDDATPALIKAYAYGNLAYLYFREKRLVEAKASYESGIRAVGDEGGSQVAIDLEGDLGPVLRELGQVDDAIALHERALERAVALDYALGAMWQRIGLCRAWLAKGDPTKSIAFARSGLDQAEALVAQLSDEAAVSARGRLDELFLAALQAASRKGDPAVAFEFLRASRGAGLWRALSSVPVADPAAEAAAEEEAGQRAAEAAAWKALYAAIVDEKVPDARVQALRTAAADAERRARETAERNEAARSSARAPTALPAQTLADAAKALPADGALVAYAGSGKDAFALVVTRAGGGRLVPLTPGGEDATRRLPSGPPSSEDLAFLAKRFVAPLALPPATLRVLVSPSAETQGVPFPAIFGDRTVVVVPFVGRGPAAGAPPAQGTGRRVVAFVDPLVDAAPLAGARAEGHAITKDVIEGEAATESAARAWLAGAHGGFDTILFGCHVRVDASDPYRSHLLLAPDAAEDGKLGARELLGLRIVPGVRLVVLSACESAVGKTYEGEGLIGLHRAFMLAGAPRVLASLWKVDDAATARFMTSFFEAWNPRDPASGRPTGKGVAAEEALRLAQKAVRGDPEYADPRFWAAWVLAGLPE